MRLATKVAALLLSAGPALADPMFEAVALPYLAGVRHGLDAEGTALGFAPIAGGGGRGPALVHRDGKVRLLELLGPGAFPAALNDAGDVAVDIQPGGPCPTVSSEIVCARRAAVWQAVAGQEPRVRELGTLGGPRSFARAIDGSGKVVGWSDLDRRSNAATGSAFVQRAFLHADGRMVELPGLGGEHGRALAMNGQGQIAGWAADAQGRHRAVLWRDGVAKELGTLGGAESEAQAINARGHVVGWSLDAQGRRRAFLWRGDGMVDLGTLGGRQAEATALLGNASIVAGSAETAAGERRACLWWDGNTLDLNQLAAPGVSTPVEAAFFSDVVAINDRVEMVATLSTGSPRDGSLRFVQHVLLVRRGAR